MTDSNRELKALEAYLKLMQGKGADDANLARRSLLLGALLPQLAGHPAENWLYRDAVEETLASIDRNDWPFFLVLTREYFHFWVGDFKMIAALHAGDGFEVVAPEPAHVDERLREVWKRLETEKFSVTEKWPLKAYLAALREEGAEKDVIDTRQKLVKLLLVQLREVDSKNGKVYRSVVESVMPLFKMQETRYLFLAVVREFFYFWIGDPDAANHIQLDAPA